MSNVHTFLAESDSPVGVSDLSKCGQCFPKVAHLFRPDMGCPFGLDVGDDCGANRDGAGAPGGDADQSGSAVRWVRGAFHVSGSFELVDEESGGLFGHLRGLGEFGESGAVWSDALEDPGLGGGEVIEACIRRAAKTRFSRAR